MKAKSLSTINSDGSRNWVYPARVQGAYRRRRNILNALLIAFFLGLPWVRIADQQVVLLDFWHGHFSFFGLNLWVHDAPLLFFFAVGAALSLAMVTALWGRIWCGWACPQTVFVDGVFRRVETWIEGDAVERRRLDAAALTLEKVTKKTLKWSVFAAIALVISHSVLAYFVGTVALREMMSRSPGENLAFFIIAMGIAGAILLDFGWFREQFCTLVCPYGRFQSVLMDQNSLAVAYDQKRGEPRRAGGDCVDCNRCVQVCPTGIDIRNGLQMECIACTACIDACDAIMLKLKKQPRLIRYAAEREMKKTYTRAAAYGILILILVSGLTWAIAKRESVQTLMVRATGEPFEMSGGTGKDRTVTNHFRLDVLNQEGQKVTFGLEIDAQAKAAGVELVSAALPLSLSMGQSKRIDVFFKFPVHFLKSGHATLPFIALVENTEKNKKVSIEKEVQLLGPYQ